MGIDPLSLGILAIAGGAAFAGAKFLGGQKRRLDDRSPTIPTAPITAEATPEQKAKIRRKTKTILTSPLTGEEEFGIGAPTLLGGGDPTKTRVVG